MTLAVSGAAVLFADIVESAAETVSKEINSNGGSARPFTVDVSDASMVTLMVAAAKELGPLKIAVNNAGIGGESNPLADYSLGGWAKVIDVNLNSVFYCMRAEIPVMLEAGGGSIVNMASILGSAGFANSSAYVTAKHSVVGLTKNAALEFAGQGIRVNAVGPGFINTPLLEVNLDQATIAYLSGKHPVGRLGTPDEVASLVAVPGQRRCLLRDRELLPGRRRLPGPVVRALVNEASAAKVRRNARQGIRVSPRSG